MNDAITTQNQSQDRAMQCTRLAQASDHWIPGLSADSALATLWEVCWPCLQTTRYQILYKCWSHDATSILDKSFRTVGHQAHPWGKTALYCWALFKWLSFWWWYTCAAFLWQDALFGHLRRQFVTHAALYAWSPALLMHGTSEANQ